MTFEEQIREEHKRIVGIRDGERFPVMSGTVVSVNEDEMICEVQLTCRYDPNVASTTPGVLLNVRTQCMDGIVKIPAVNADCEVAELDGPGTWSLIRASKYTKVMVTVGSSKIVVKDGLIEMNGGDLGGLVKLQELENNLNALKSYVETMKTAIANGITAVGVGSSANGETGAETFNTEMAGQEINFEEMENTNVKHG